MRSKLNLQIEARKKYESYAWGRYSTKELVKVDKKEITRVGRRKMKQRLNQDISEQME